jgi:hypothetical protein
MNVLRPTAYCIFLVLRFSALGSTAYSYNIELDKLLWIIYHPIDCYLGFIYFNYRKGKDVFILVIIHFYNNKLMGINQVLGGVICTVEKFI